MGKPATLTSMDEPLCSNDLQLVIVVVVVVVTVVVVVVADVVAAVNSKIGRGHVAALG